MKNETVHVGKDGYLFLKGGRHSPFKYLDSSEKPDLGEKKKIFSNNINNRKKVCDSKGVAYSHFISPDKHYICTQYVGRTVGEKSVAEEFLDFFFSQSDRADAGLIVYPRTPLARDPEKSTYRVDTHLKPFGTLVCLKELAKYNKSVSKNLYGLDDFKEEDLERYIKSIGLWEGDLGSKLIPVVQEERLILSLPKHVFLYGNNISGGNNGICDIYFNRLNIKNCHGGRVLVFGDSFGRSLAKMISLFSQEVVFMRTPYFHPEIVNMNSPDVVITQNVERYLPSVMLDGERPSFFSYLYTDGVAASPAKKFSSAFSSILSYPRKPYKDFLKKLKV